VIKEYTPDENSILKSRESLAQTPSVADLTGNEFEKGKKNLFEQVSDYFDSIGNNIYNDELGDISLNRRSARDDIAHGVGRLKAVTFAAVPDVLKSGEVISFTKNHKGRGYDTAIIAAPVNIKGERHYVAAVVNRSSVKSGQIDTQRFYLHEVYSDKKASELFKTVWRFLQNVGHGSSEAINNNIGYFSESVNSKDKKNKQTSNSDASKGE
jgi:hypothetical protein